MYTYLVYTCYLLRTLCIDGLDAKSLPGQAIGFATDHLEVLYCLYCRYVHT